LQQEGFTGFNCHIERVGDVMYDAALFYRDRARRPIEIPACLSEGDFALATLHRPENTDDFARLATITTALDQLHEDLPIVFPMHPRTRGSLEAAHLKLATHVIPPVGYLEMVWLLKHCRLVLTDSGGLQKEAYFFHKPCVTLRDETEWVELVDAGVNVLAGADSEKIIHAAKDALSGTRQYDQALYGDGFVAKNIVNTIISIYRSE
jgi:UDP-GlcNAc3NAcA epimerase